jgi:hypothetical protein
MQRGDFQRLQVMKEPLHFLAGLVGRGLACISINEDLLSDHFQEIFESNLAFTEPINRRVLTWNSGCR